MAYKQYPNTYLSKLPYELQDKINDHIIEYNKKKVLVELKTELDQQFPEEGIFNSESPSLYYKCLLEIINILCIKSDDDPIEVTSNFENCIYFFLRHYKYPYNGFTKFDIRGIEIDNYYTDVIYEINHIVKHYTKILYLECSLSHLTYQELLQFKKIAIKHINFII